LGFGYGSKKEGRVQEKNKGVKYFDFLPTNIGKFEALDDKFAEILETDRHCFRGFQGQVQNNLHQHFAVVHTVELGKNEIMGPDGKKDEERSAYTLTSYLKKAPWVFNGRYGNRVCNGAVVYDNGGPVITTQGTFNEDETKSNWEMDIAWKRRDMCIQLKTAAFDAVGFSYTQPLTERLAFGGEVFLSPWQDKGRLRFVGKYTDEHTKDNALATVTTGMGADQCTFTYLKKVTDSLGVLAEADFSLDSGGPGGMAAMMGGGPKGPPKMVSVLKLGYSFKTETKTGHPVGTMARAIVDTTGNVSCLVDETFNEGFCSATLSARVNYWKNLYDFGIGLLVAI